jgi:hypothetical protein
MSLIGMGQFEPGPDSAAACGGNTPCVFSDWFGPSAACLAFLQCADPTNPVYVTANSVYNSANAAVAAQGIPWLVALSTVNPAAAQEAATDIYSTATGAVSSVASGALNLAQNATPPVAAGVCMGIQIGTGVSCTEIMLGLAVVAGLLIYGAVKKR